MKRKNKNQQAETRAAEAEMARRRREHPYASEAQLESIRLVGQAEILPSGTASYKYPWRLGQREMVDAPVKVKVRKREMAVA